MQMNSRVRYLLLQHLWASLELLPLLQIHFVLLDFLMNCRHRNYFIWGISTSRLETVMNRASRETWMFLTILSSIWPQFCRQFLCDRQYLYLMLRNRMQKAVLNDFGSQLRYGRVTEYNVLPCGIRLQKNGALSLMVWYPVGRNECVSHIMPLR